MDKIYVLHQPHLNHLVRDNSIDNCRHIYHLRVINSSWDCLLYDQLYRRLSQISLFLRHHFSYHFLKAASLEATNYSKSSTCPSLSFTYSFSFLFSILLQSARSSYNLLELLDTMFQLDDIFTKWYFPTEEIQAIQVLIL